MGRQAGDQGTWTHEPDPWERPYHHAYGAARRRTLPGLCRLQATEARYNVSITQEVQAWHVPGFDGALGFVDGLTNFLTYRSRSPP